MIACVCTMSSCGEGTLARAGFAALACDTCSVLGLPGNTGLAWIGDGAVRCSGGWLPNTIIRVKKT